MGEEADGSASAYATGGGGVVLEHAYGGALLAELLLGGPVGGLGDEFTPRLVKFQQSSDSPVDDLVVVGDGPSGERTLFIGVRRKPSIGASKRPFVALMVDYLRMVEAHDAELTGGSWRLGLAVEAPHTPTNELAKLAVFARQHPSSDAFRAAVNAARATTGKVRQRLTNVDEVVTASIAAAGIAVADDAARGDLSWRLLRSLRVLDLRLEGDDAVGRTSLVARLVPIAGNAAAADELRRHLNELAAAYATGAAEVDEGMLRRDLSGRARVAASPAFRRSWQALHTLEDSLQARTRRVLIARQTAAPTAVRQFIVDRSNLRGELVEAMSAAGRAAAMLVVHGEPDTGKSALTLDAAEAVRAAGGTVVALSLRDLLPGSLITVEQLLHAPARAVFAATAVAAVRLLVVDGAEAAQEGGAGLLRDLALAARNAGLGVVAVTRDDARPAIREALTGPGPAAPQQGQVEVSAPAEVEVPPLTDEETRRVRETFPELTRLSSDPRSTWLLRRLGILDLLLRAEATASLPDGTLSEADVFGAVWFAWVRRRDQYSPGNATPDGREQVMVQLARASLAASGGDAAAAVGDPYALPSLRSDGLLLPAGAQFAFRTGDEFATDTVRDFALARLFLREGVETLRAAGAPRWALRAARLACQSRLIGAAQGAVDRVAAVAAELRTLREQFAALAQECGDRWADLPWEAGLSAGPADALIEASTADLLDLERGPLARVVRLGRQRFTSLGVADPALAAPVVAFLVTHSEEIRRADHRLSEQADELAAAWLRGVREIERSSDDAEPVAPWRPLRAQLRDHILTDSDRPSDTTVECLALLGADTDVRVENALRRLAADRPAELAACVERFDAMMSIAATNADLLFELTEAYYIEKSHPGWGMIDFGVRRHRFGPGIGAPFAGSTFGPFWLLLRTAPPRALTLINRMLDHTSRRRVHSAPPQADQQPEDTSVAEPDAPGLTLDIPGVGARWYVGDDHVWGWYRGTGVGPYAGMSALLAVEQWADQLLAHLPLRSVMTVLLRDAHNLAMLGLVAGLLIRHAEQVTDEADALLACPGAWEMEFSRAAREGTLHAQGPDLPDTPGRERRRWTLADVASQQVVNARLRGDENRLQALHHMGDDLVEAAAARLPSSGEPKTDQAASGGPPDVTAAAGAGGETDALLAVRGWASMLDSRNYHLRAESGSVSWEWRAPADIHAAAADGQTDLRRGTEAYRLATTYGLQTVPPYLDQPPPLPPAAALASDAAIARDLLTTPPWTGPADKTEAPTAVAASIVRAAAQTFTVGSREDVEWAVITMAEAALNHPGEPRRLAAAAAPCLLLPAFTETHDPDVPPILDEKDLTTALPEVLTALTTSGSTEVRRIAARSTGPVWAAPCGPGPTGGTGCRHVIAWSAVEAGARDVALQPWTPAGREYRQLDGPLTTALTNSPAKHLHLDRLGPPLIAACDAARSDCCIAPAAIPVREALLDAYARTAVLWGAEGYQHRNEAQYAVTAALLAAPTHQPQPVLHLIRGLANQARALSETLTALAVVATYDEVARAQLRAVWPSIMTTVLDAADAGSNTLYDSHWGDYALAALIPSPTMAISDTDPTTSINSARAGWPTPQDLADQITRWLPHAAGQRHAADNLIGLLQTVPLPQQAQIGLPWLCNVIIQNSSVSAHGTWLAVEWLTSLRDGHVLDTTTRPLYDELVDALAADNYQEAVRLQKRDE
jgi:hypothetical protein